MNSLINYWTLLDCIWGSVKYAEQIWNGSAHHSSGPGSKQLLSKQSFCQSAILVVKQSTHAYIYLFQTGSIGANVSKTNNYM